MRNLYSTTRSQEVMRRAFRVMHAGQIDLAGAKHRLRHEMRDDAGGYFEKAARNREATGAQS
jgi:hypothetical protein